MTLFEVNLHTVPHLKALSIGIEAFRSHWSGRPFIVTTAIWKVPILYHTEANCRFVLLLIVASQLQMEKKCSCCKYKNISNLLVLYQLKIKRLVEHIVKWNCSLKLFLSLLGWILQVLEVQLKLVMDYFLRCLTYEELHSSQRLIQLPSQ